MESKEEVILDYRTTILPPKKLFLKPEDSFFEFRRGKIFLEKPEEKILIFGMHLYDIYALALLDKIFSEIPDPYWIERRRNCRIIGIGHTPYYASFYQALNIFEARGYDLFFDKADGVYAAIIGTRVGARLVERFSHLFKEKKFVKKDRIPKGKLIDLQKVCKAIEKGFQEKIWERLAKKCMGCGICSFVCPLCYCFDVEDGVDLKGGGKRLRRWDSCLLPDFSLIAGGVNFRDTLRKRIWYWYHHKFVRSLREWGEVGCVGCGRCILFCPAKINLRDVLEELEEIGR